MNALLTWGLVGNKGVNMSYRDLGLRELQGFSGLGVFPPDP